MQNGQQMTYFLQGRAALYVGLATECCTHLNKDKAGDDGVTSLGIVS